MNLKDVEEGYRGVM